MPDVEGFVAIAEHSPILLVLLLFGVILVLTIVAAVAGHLWTRWMSRIETRLDIVEEEHRQTVRHAATRADLSGAEDRIQARLDRIETRIDFASAANRGAE